LALIKDRTMAFLALFLLVGATLAGATGLTAPDIPGTDGSDGADGFSGSDRDDQFNGAGGNDLLNGGDGSDSLSGGAGNDWLIGLNGQDLLDGGPGSDVLIGGQEADQLFAGAGDDFIESANLVDETTLQNSLNGIQRISDVVFEYDMSQSPDVGDHVDLGDGDDTVVAGGADTVTGGEGADEFASGDWISGDAPVEITDFDTTEDVLSFVYNGEGPEPDLTIERDSRTGITTLRADGEAVAILRNSSPEFSLQNVVIGRYAA
jgi:Ca2+-binding RTX toxin-like protein